MLRAFFDARWRPIRAALVVAASLAAGAPVPASAAPSRVTPAVVAMVVEPSAEDIERARELYDNGVALYEEGSYQGAAMAFQRAYELSEDNNLLYNIALAYDRMDEFEKAIEYLDRYRALAPQSERAELERRKKSLVTRLERQRDGETSGEPEPASSDDELDDAVIPAPASDTPPPPARPERRVPPAAWALSATAAVGLGVGIGFGATSLQASRSGREGCTEAGDALYCQSTSGPELQRSRTLALVSDISFAVAGAAAVGAIVVLVLHARRKKAGQLAVAPMTWPGGAGMTLARRF